MAKNKIRKTKRENAIKKAAFTTQSDSIVDENRTESKKAAKKPKTKVSKSLSVGGSAKRKKAAKKKTAKRAPRFARALNKDALEATLDNLSQDQLFELRFGVNAYLYWSIGDPTTESLQEIKRSNPALSLFIDFNTVIKRLVKLAEFQRSSFGVSLGKFFPELVTVNQACSDRISVIPNSVAKADSWMRVVAADAGANADLEAAVYLASRGDTAAIDVDEIRDRWHASICIDIEQGRSVGKVPEAVIQRAQDRTISIAESAHVLRSGDTLYSFFSYRDEEEDHIDQTMFRAVEWLKITGFNQWLESHIADLSVGPQGGIVHSLAVWWLFHWCRSDLALRMANRNGLEAWLWALMNGPLEHSTPWRIFWGSQDSRIRDYLPIAGLIPFLWHRINPANISYDVPQAALELLAQTQLRNGAWPLFSDDAEPSLMSTYAAVHGLGISKPQGWEGMTRRAADWLIAQQEPLGFWNIQGGPTVAITVQVLDAIAIGHGNGQLTFSTPTEDINRAAGNEEAMLSEPVYDCEGMEWHAPALPETTSQTLENAQAEANPRLALLVATETELRQVLRLMRPLPRRRRLWKVTHGHETAYIGRVGSFEAVVVMCSMGTQGATGATLTANAVIQTWDPKAIAFVGIAFGASRTKQKPADVLVASQIIPYESQRRGKKTLYRNPVPPTGERLLNRFRNAGVWEFNRPDGNNCEMHFGAILSGDKLVDSDEFKQELLDQFPSAIGGEMEGAGLWGAAARAQKEWIIVKAVCDWGDGNKHDDYQEMAAAAAASLCFHVFDDPNVLEGF